VFLAIGGANPDTRYTRTTERIAACAPAATMVTFEGAGHGAHLSHPDAFAEFVREVLRASVRDAMP
jgi:pimeloyl-ACP methyl ester carboxylesterase